MVSANIFPYWSLMALAGWLTWLRVLFQYTKVVVHSLPTPASSLAKINKQFFFFKKRSYGQENEHLTSTLAPVHDQTVKWSFLLNCCCMEGFAFKKYKTSQCSLKYFQVHRHMRIHIAFCQSQVDRLKITIFINWYAFFFLTWLWVRSHKEEW